MMLHVRDCPGTTSSFDVCPFPWCRKVKHLLYHLVSCMDPQSCPICSPKHLSDSLTGLVGLNEYRLKMYRQRLMAAAKETKSKGGGVANVRPVAQKPAPRKDLELSRSPVGPSRSTTIPQRSVEPTSKPTKLIPAVQSMPGPSSSNAPPVKTVVVDYEDPDLGHVEKSLTNNDDENEMVDDNVVEAGAGIPSNVNTIPRMETVKVDDVHDENEVGEMILDEVEGDMGAYANVDDEIAEVLAKEESGSGEEEVERFVAESVETLVGSASSETMAMECEVAKLIMEEATNLKVKEEMDETLVPFPDPGVDGEYVADPISISSTPANQNAVMTSQSNTSILFDPSTSETTMVAFQLPPLGAVKEELELSSVNSPRGPTGEEASPPLGVKLESSVDDVTDTSVSVMEGGLSTQASSEALKAC